METKCVNVTKQAYTNMILNKLWPAVKEKWPRDRSTRIQTIGIQQDNPKTHIQPTDEDWINAKDADNRFKFELKEQPANSPDTNILDLGFFRSLQSLQWKQPPASTIDELIANVQQAWELYEPKQLAKIWLTHQAVMDCILDDHGGNDYELPHLGKDKHFHDGQLPASLMLSEGAKDAVSYLEQV